jgi:Tfp pilus assembly protein PilO
MKKNNKIFIVVTILFVLIMIGFTIQFMTMTTPPWEKRSNEVKNKYKVQYNERLGLKNIDSIKAAREAKKHASDN